MFSILTGETDYTIYVGMSVSCKVTRIQDYRAELIVDGAMKGFVKKEYLSDTECTDISQFMSENSVSSGVVIGVYKDKMLVEVSMRESHLKMSELDWIEFDPEGFYSVSYACM
jgi:ribosomal protein S1